MGVEALGITLEDFFLILLEQKYMRATPSLTASFAPQTFTELPVNSISGHANMETCEIRGEHVLLSGWVVSGEGFSPVTRIAVVDSAKGVGIGYIAIDVERPDVKAVYPFAPLVSGYNAVLPADLCGADPVNTLMLYGITDDASSFMGIPGLGAMLSLPPFFDPRQEVAPELLPYLTADKLVWADIVATHRCNISTAVIAACGTNIRQGRTRISKLCSSGMNTGEDFTVGYWQMSNLGEITTYPRWLELADAIREKTPFTILSNFCKRFSEEELLMLARAKYLTISLDTTDRALLKRIRTGADPVRIVKNIGAVRDAAAKAGLPAPYVNLSTVVSPPVVPYLPSLALLAVALKINHILIQDVSMDDAVPGMAEDLALSTVGDDASLKTSLTDMLDILRRNGIMYTLLGGLRRFDASPQENSTEAAQPKGIWGKKTKLCLAPWTRLYLGIDGNVNPCAHIASVGYLSEKSSLPAVCNGPRMQAIRRGLLTGELEHCCAVCRFGSPCTVEKLVDRIKYYREKEEALSSITLGLFE